MSVLIDWDIPKACRDCSLQIGGYCQMYTDDIKRIDDVNLIVERPDWCPLVEIPTPHGDLADLSDMVHPNDSMRRMTIDEQLRRTCEGWSADRKQYVVIEGSET